MKEGREGGREGKMDGWMRRREGKKVGWMDGWMERREGREGKERRCICLTL